MLACRSEIALGDRGLGHLAVIVRDCHRLFGHARRAQSLVHRRGLWPVVLQFVNAHEQRERRGRIAAAVGELQQQLLRAVVQAGTDVVARQLGHRRVAIAQVDAGAVDEVLVHADGAVHLAPPPIEAAEREVRVDGLVVVGREAEEHLERALAACRRAGSAGLRGSARGDARGGGGGIRRTRPWRPSRPPACP